MYILLILMQLLKQMLEVNLITKTIGAQIQAGYKVALSAAVSIMPQIGLKYNSFKDGAYTQTGGGVHNVKIDSKKK